MKDKLLQFLKNKRFVALCWFAVTLAVPIKHIFFTGVHNNYHIFKHVFYHTIQQRNLYLYCPYHYDTNHYGPIFGLIFTPFALLPDQIGCLLWACCISLALFLAIYHLSIEWRYKVIIYYVIMNEMFTSLISMQTNALIAALIIAAFIAIRKEKDCWSACFIMLGFFIKLYGIVGLCFFFFSKHKLKFIGYLICWGIIFFVLPMLISSPSFIIQSYGDWYDSLVAKNLENAVSSYQDISVTGMMRRIFGNRNLSNLIILIPALIIFALQYVRVKLYDDFRYQLALLASTLLFVVLFSSSSESPTYIIAMTGVAIWFILQENPYRKSVIALLVFALLLTSFSPTDLIPKAGRIFIREYSLKALPCLFVWLVLVYQIIWSGKGFKKKL
jgi:hypothetical protein